MNKNLYVKPEMEVIEMELQSSVMTPSVEIDSSNTTDGEFDAKQESLWGN